MLPRSISSLWLDKVLASVFIPFVVEVTLRSISQKKGDLGGNWYLWLAFKTFLLDKAIITSEMRLYKLNYNNRGRNNSQHLFCTKWQASESALHVWTLITPHSSSACRLSRSCSGDLWSITSHFLHLCILPFWVWLTIFYVWDSSRSWISKDWAAFSECCCFQQEEQCPFPTEPSSQTLAL